MLRAANGSFTVPGAVTAAKLVCGGDEKDLCAAKDDQSIELAELRAVVAAMGWKLQVRSLLDFVILF